MDIAKIVLEEVAENMISILVSGYNMSVPEAYDALSESRLLYELEVNPYLIVSTTFNDCLKYAEDIAKKRNLKDKEHIKSLEVL